ncbi:hypothetical protein HN615_04515 [Candidatus Woesearchaeota archaeon]|nr:hypothetical protein [Candidatus Woesearchaeota archaeon]
MKTIFWEDERGGGAFESRKEAFQITSSLLGGLYVVVLILVFIYFLIFIAEPDNSPDYGSLEHQKLVDKECNRQDGNWFECMKRQGYVPTKEQKRLWGVN